MYYRGKGYGEAGEAVEEFVEAEDKYAAKEALRGLMAGGVTVLQEISAEQYATATQQEAAQEQPTQPDEEDTEPSDPPEPEAA